MTANGSAGPRMEKHRASWKAEYWMRRKGHSPDRFQGSKKTPGTGDFQNLQSLRRVSSERIRPLDRQENLLDSDASVSQKLEKTNGAISEQGGQRSHHKDKAHKKGQRRLLRSLVNLLTKTGSEEQKERGGKKSKEKSISPQGPEPPEAFVDPQEPTFKKKDKEKGGKKSKEKSISPQDPEPPEAFVDPQEPTFKKKDKEKGGKKSKEKSISPQDPEPLEAVVEPLEPTSKKKDKRSTLKKAFSFKKYGNEEAKKSSAVDSRSPEARRPAKPTFLPLCISYRPASLTTPDSGEEEVHDRWFTEVRVPDSTGLSHQVGRPPPKEEPLKRDSESKDDIIQGIVTVLREEGDKYNEKIKGDLNFKAVWHSLSLSSIQTLAEDSGNQEENQEPDENQVERRYHLTNKCTGNTKHAVHQIMGWRDHIVMHPFGHMPYNNMQYGASKPFNSPD